MLDNQPPALGDLPATSLHPIAMPKDIAANARIDAMVAFGDALYLSFSTTAGQEAVWRFDLAQQTWRSLPGVATEAGASASQGQKIRPADPAFAETGLMAMAVFQGTGDKTPCLYVVQCQATDLQLFRSTDGDTVAHVLTLPRAHHPGPVALLVREGWLVLAGAGDDKGEPCVLGSADPATGGWIALSPPGFGDPENLAITALALHQGRLYAGTANSVAGFQIWASSPSSDPDVAGWTCILSEGATRHGMNPQVGLLASHQDQLWIGTAMDRPPSRWLEWPAAELLRIEPDGVWELVAGDARLTPDGLRMPLSLMGPGFDDPGVTRLAAMATTADGLLLLGGGPLAGLWLSQDGDDWQALLEDDGTDNAAQAAGGVTAMATAAGKTWIAMDGRLYTLEQSA